MDFTAFAAELAGYWRPAGRSAGSGAGAPAGAQAGGADSVAILRAVDSTNLSARRMVQEFAAEDSVAPGIWLFAFQQLQGRGRLGRSWISPAGHGVYATLLIPGVAAAALERLPLAVAIALSEAVEELIATPCRVKWPNDLLLDGRKVGGILIESVRRGDEPSAVICGFGINVHHEAAKLPANATSLVGEATAALPSLAEIAFRLARAVAAAVGRLEVESAGELARRYRARSAHVEGDTLRCSVGGEIVEGRVMGFDERGFLGLRTAAGERWLSAGEVIES